MCQQLLLPALQLKYLISRGTAQTGHEVDQCNGCGRGGDTESVVDGLDAMVASLFGRCGLVMVGMNS